MRKASFLAASVVAGALTAGPAAAGDPIVIYNQSTNKCLQPTKGSTAPGEAIVEEPCNPPGANAAQTWRQIAVSGGSHFQNVSSGLCLDARGNARNGTPVQQWPCNKITNEIWQPTPYPSGPNAPKGPGLQLISRVSHTSSHCLDIPGGQAENGLPMQIWSCNGTTSQEWELEVPGSCVTNDPYNSGCGQAKKAADPKAGG